MNQQKLSKNGFTIIEVVLVLAIAGLIFLMVFIALPALQRSQRDTQRKNDVGRFLESLNRFQSDNRGSVPDTQADINSFVGQYLLQGGDTFADPSGAHVASIGGQDSYTIVWNQAAKATSTLVNDNSDSGDLGIMYYFTGATCENGGSGGGVQTSGVGSRKIAVRMVLEGGGVYCSSN